jgi:hypothetical protein
MNPQQEDGISDGDDRDDCPKTKQKTAADEQQEQLPVIPVVATFIKSHKERRLERKEERRLAKELAKASEPARPVREVIEKEKRPALRKLQGHKGGHHILLPKDHRKKLMRKYQERQHKMTAVEKSKTSKEKKRRRERSDSY